MQKQDITRNFNSDVYAGFRGGGGSAKYDTCIPYLGHKQGEKIY